MSNLILSKKRQAAEDKKRRQEKIMTVLGIVMAVVVVVIGVYCIARGIYTALNRELSQEEMKALFQSTDALPDKDDVLVGTWYYYVGSDVRSTYELSADGTMMVYERNGNDFTLTNMAPYRVREKAKTLYVYPQGSSEVITYEYDITLQEDGDQRAYIMVWINGDKGWSLLKVAE